MMPLVKIRLIVLLAIPGLIAAAVPLAVMAQDAPRQTQVIEMIYATTLTVAELSPAEVAEAASACGAWVGSGSDSGPFGAVLPALLRGALALRAILHVAAAPGVPAIIATRTRRALALRPRASRR